MQQLVRMPIDSGFRDLWRGAAFEALLQIQSSGTFMPHTEQVRTSQRGVICDRSAALHSGPARITARGVRLQRAVLLPHSQFRVLR